VIRASVLYSSLAILNVVFYSLMLSELAAVEGLPTDVANKWF
jgi:hypothetical protein